MSKLLVVPPTSVRWQQVRWAILGCYVLLAMLYATVMPIFEISDEASHYPVVDYLASHGELPVQDKNRPNPWDWEAAQPPLYYAVSALLVAPFDRSDLYDKYWVPNPHGQIGITNTTHNRNGMTHNWEAQSFPWDGAALHVRVVRAFSIVLSAASVWLMFAIGRQIAPQTPAIAVLMMALTAFNPMFIAIGASVNNDNMATFFVTLAIALSFSSWHDGLTWRRVCLLALVCVLAAASKLSGTHAFIFAGLTIALTVYKRRLPFRQLVLAGTVFVMLWGVLLGWWYIRNWQLYDDPLGNTHMAETVGLREPSIGVVELLREEWFSFYTAYWGAFGMLTFTGPPALFYYTGVVVGLAALGAVYGLRQFSLSAFWDWLPFGLLMGLLAVGSLSVISWSLLTPASQGRLLFPYNSAVVALLAVGLHQLLRSRLAMTTVMPLAILAVYCGLVVIPNAYALPPTIDHVPSNVRLIDVRFDTVGLVAVQVDETPITQADPVLSVTLYWHSARTSEPLSYFVTVFGRNTSGEMVVLGKRDSYPGYGLLATNLWQPDRIYAETIAIELDQWPTDLDLPLQPRLHIGMRDNETDTIIQAYNTADEPIEAVFVNDGRLIDPDTRQRDEFVAEFINVARLYDLQITQAGTTLMVDMRWEPLRPQADDLTVFVQLIVPDDPTLQLASGDSPPRQGWWPTSSWVVGNIFSDRYTLSLDGVPSGGYELLIGLYHPETFARVPVTDGPYPDAIVQPIHILTE